MKTFTVKLYDDQGREVDSAEVVWHERNARHDQIVLMRASSASDFVSGGQCGTLNLPKPPPHRPPPNRGPDHGT